MPAIESERTESQCCLYFQVCSNEIRAQNQEL